MKIKLKSLEETKFLARRIFNQIKNGGIVLLKGGLGSGKTTFTKFLLKEFGIHKIKSPTYNVIKEYSKNEKNIYHLDLYRIDQFDDLLENELSEIFENSKNITIIEWADKIPTNLTPDKHLEIQLKHLQKDTKEAEILNNYISNQNIKKIWKKLKTPKHVIKHMEKVAQVCNSIVSHLEENKIEVDKNLIIQSALLHDALRVCDFKELNTDKFNEEITEEKLETWKLQRKKYGETGHAKAMANYLAKKGYKKIAKMIQMHDFKEIENLKTLEEKLLYYGDKRVNQDKIVNLKTRFKEGRKRNFKKGDNLDEIIRFEKLNFKLESELQKITNSNLKDL